MHKWSLQTPHTRVQMLKMAYSHTHMCATARRRVATQVCILSMVSETKLILPERQSDSKSAKCVCNHVKSNAKQWRAKARDPHEPDKMHNKLCSVDDEITK